MYKLNENSGNNPYFCIMKEREEIVQDLKRALLGKLKEALVSVFPVILLVFVLSVTPWVDITSRELWIFLVSALFLIFGIGLFNLGADMAMTPMGQYIGEGLTKSKKLGILVGVSFVMGLLITIAEPDLAVLAGQVAAVINSTTLIWTVGIGVGLMLLAGVLKIVFHYDLTGILLFGYMLLFSLAAILIERGNGPLLAMSFDSGGVTTGPITVPFIMALGVGIALTVGGRNASENSFGLIALCSLGPIIAVLALSMLSKGNLEYSVPDYSMAKALEGGLEDLLKDTMWDVGKSLVLIVGSFFVLQFTVLKLPVTKIGQIMFGIIYTFVGLVLSVIRVYYGFSVLYYLVPGYLLSLGLSFFVPKLYTAIAFDSGGVASGPLTSSFILPLVVGACVTLQGADGVLDFAFGVVAMVAMTPLITIQSLGFKSVVATRRRKKLAMRRIMAAADDQIIYFE